MFLPYCIYDFFSTWGSKNGPVCPAGGKKCTLCKLFHLCKKRCSAIFVKNSKSTFTKIKEFGNFNDSLLKLVSYNFLKYWSY